MNTGQMLLVIGALALLSTIALSVNSTLLDNDQVEIEAQAGLLAVSLCQGELEERLAAGFDSLEVGSFADSLFTPFAAFACTTQVDYVEEDALDVPVPGPTSLKLVSVAVKSQYMSGAVSLSAIAGEY